MCWMALKFPVPVFFYSQITKKKMQWSCVHIHLYVQMCWVCLLDGCFVFECARLLWWEREIDRHIHIGVFFLYKFVLIWKKWSINCRNARVSYNAREREQIASREFNCWLHFNGNGREDIHNLIQMRFIGAIIIQSPESHIFIPIKQTQK